MINSYQTNRCKMKYNFISCMNHRHLIYWTYEIKKELKMNNRFYKILFLIIFSFSFQSLKAETAAPTESSHPIVILGGGIGALTSAIYLERAGIHTIVIEGRRPGGSISQSPLVQNWPGVMEISGQDLVGKVKEQALANGATLLSQEVISVDFSARPYVITTREIADREKIHRYKAYTCIIALGAEPNFLGVPGEQGDNGYWGRGVYSCAVCDGALFKEKTVAVIGGGDSAIIEALYLSNIAKQVYVIVRSKDFRGVDSQKKQQLHKKGNIQVLFETSVEEIQGDGSKLTHLHLNNTGKHLHYQLAVDGAFLAIGAKPNSYLFKNQLQLDPQGYIILKKDQETSIEGVFAIGDVVDPVYKQAISAAGDGAKAALQAEKYLSSLPKDFFVSNTSQIKPQTIKQHTDTAVVELASAEELQQLLEGSNKASVVDFYSPWCGPCKQLHPVFEEKATAFEGKYQFIRVNVSKFSDFVSQYSIVGVPTIIFFDKHGKIIDRKVGFDEANEFLNKLN